MILPVKERQGEKQSSQKPWGLPERGLTVYYGCPKMPRLSHYFLPTFLLDEKRVLYFDGANQISPHLIARFATERSLKPSVFNELILVSRAFTCFQLTGLIERAPEYLRRFQSNVLIVTALPDIHFDEDVQELEARASFKHTIYDLVTLTQLSIPITACSES